MKTLVLFLLAFNALAHAQVASATLLGDVRDESSALAQGVTVTALQNATGFTRTTITGEQGTYRFDELLPGAYTVTARKPGFRAITAEDVTLEVNQKGRLD